jgi:hypothetical protein
MTPARLRVVRVVRVGSAKPFRNLYRYFLNFYFLGLRKGTRTTRTTRKPNTGFWRPIVDQLLTNPGPFRWPRSSP